MRAQKLLAAQKVQAPAEQEESDEEEKAEESESDSDDELKFGLKGVKLGDRLFSDKAVLK